MRERRAFFAFHEFCNKVEEINNAIPEFTEHNELMQELLFCNSEKFAIHIRKGNGIKISQALSSLWALLPGEHRQIIGDLPDNILFLPQVLPDTISYSSNSDSTVTTSNGKFQDGRSAIASHLFQIDKSPDIILREATDVIIPENSYVGVVRSDITSEPQHRSPYRKPSCQTGNIETLSDALNNPDISKFYISLLSNGHYVLFTLDLSNEANPAIKLYNSIQYSFEQELNHKQCLSEILTKYIASYPDNQRVIALKQKLETNIDVRLADINSSAEIEEVDPIVQTCYEQPGIYDCQTSAAILIKHLIEDRILPKPRYYTDEGLAILTPAPPRIIKEVAAIRLFYAQTQTVRVTSLIDTMRAQLDIDTTNRFENYSTNMEPVLQAKNLLRNNRSNIIKYFQSYDYDILTEGDKYLILSTIDIFMGHEPSKSGRNLDCAVVKYSAASAANKRIVFNSELMNYLGGVVICPNPKEERPITPDNTDFKNINEIKDLLMSFKDRSQGVDARDLYKFVLRFNQTQLNFSSKEVRDDRIHVVKLLDDFIETNSTAILQIEADFPSEHCQLSQLSDKVNKIRHRFNSAAEILEAIGQINGNQVELLIFLQKLGYVASNVWSNMSSTTKEEIYNAIIPYNDLISELKENPEHEKIVNYYERYTRKKLLPSNTVDHAQGRQRPQPESSTNLLTTPKDLAKASGGSSSLSTSSDIPMSRTRSTTTSAMTSLSISSGRHEQISESSLQKLYNICQRSSSLDANNRIIIKITFSDLPQGVSTRQISFDQTGNPLIFDKKGNICAESPLHKTELEQHAQKILDLFDLMTPGTSVNIEKSNISIKKNIDNTIAVDLNQLKPGIIDSLMQTLSTKQAPTFGR